MGLLENILDFQVNQTIIVDMGEDFQFWTPYINPVKKKFTISSTEKPKESVPLCIRNSGSNNDVKDVKQI